MSRPASEPRTYLISPNLEPGLLRSWRRRFGLIPWDRVSVEPEQTPAIAVVRYPPLPKGRKMVEAIIRSGVLSEEELSAQFSAHGRSVRSPAASERYSLRQIPGSDLYLSSERPK